MDNRDIDFCSKCKSKATCFCKSCANSLKFCSDCFLEHSMEKYDKNHVMGPLFIKRSQDLTDKLLKIKGNIKKSMVYMQKRVLGDIHSAFSHLNGLASNRLKEITNQVEWLVYNIDEILALERIPTKTNNEIISGMASNKENTLKKLENLARLGKINIPAVVLSENRVVISIPAIETTGDIEHTKLLKNQSEVKRGKEKMLDHQEIAVWIVGTARNVVSLLGTIKMCVLRAM